MVHSKLLNVVCIDIQNTPTKVFTIGGDIHSNPKEVILVIPGNLFRLFLFFYRISESIYCQTVKDRAIRVMYPAYDIIFQVILG